jgi:acetyltransferase AlgX (SGNH hydrolase-like protein)
MKRRMSLGVVIPALVAFTLLVDASSRFVPFLPEPVVFQNAILFRHLGEAFVRNASLSGVQYGDLARFGNLPGHRLYHPSSFTTDNFGYRNVPSPDPVQALLFGSSFSYGWGLNDADTLSAQLSSLSGCRVYNAAVPDPARQLPSAKEIRELAEKLGMKHGFVIIERVERLGLLPASARTRRWEAAARRLPGYSHLRALAQSALTMTQKGSLQLLLEHAFHQLQNDLVLPNPHASLVTKADLVTGDWMLFYADEVKLYRAQHTSSVEYWDNLNVELRRDNLALVVLLVPNKYTVYHPFLIDPGLLKFDPGRSLVYTEVALRQAGVSTFDVTPLFMEQAELAIGDRSYLYFRDDSHWNAAGVRVAAEALQKVLATTGHGCFSGPRSSVK